MTFHKHSNSHDHSSLRVARLVQLALSFALLCALCFGSLFPVVALADTTKGKPRATTQAMGAAALLRAQLGFDPLSSPLDKIPAPVSHPQITTRTDAPVRPVSDPNGAAPVANEPVDSYQIQLFNAAGYNEALLEKGIASEIFALGVRIEFEAPFFKVRIGDFRDQKLADDFLAKIVRPSGYPEAWVVRTRNTPNSGFESVSPSAPPQPNPLTPTNPSQKPQSGKRKS